MVARSSWSYRSDVWWAHVAAALTFAVGLIGVIGASDRHGPAVYGLVTIANANAFEVKARWPRLPTLALVACTAAPLVVADFYVWSEGTFFLLVVVIYFVALTEADWRLGLAVEIAIVGAPALVAAFGDHPFRWPFWMIGITFGWLSGLQMRRFRILVVELEATRERLAAQAVHLERRRIAADLHDLVGHSLTVVLLYLTGARRQLEDDPAGAADALREAEEIGRASLAEIRRNVAALRDAGDGAMTPTPGAPDLSDLVDQMVAAGSTIDLHVEGDLAAVEAIVGVVVYRVVQESLNNATRHAPGAAVAIAIAVGSGAVEVSVIDAGSPAVNGKGKPGVGLVGMRERVEAVGGTLQAGPAAGGAGWAVRARVPRPS